MFEVVVFFLIVVFLGGGNFLRLPTTHRLRLLPLAVALFRPLLWFLLWLFIRLPDLILVTSPHPHGGFFTFFSHFVLRSCKIAFLSISRSLIDDTGDSRIGDSLECRHCGDFSKQGWKGISNNIFSPAHA